ncbi:MAG: AzlD domain-containing protein [Thalassobaculaceae bacterium]|nr:AzlD domain-containing protein [Thalassobaculaceae bacterium]
MSEDGLVWAAILAMAVATWATRISGFWLMGLVPEGGFMRRALNHLPGALVISILSPIVIDGGWAPAAAVAVAVVILRAGVTATFAMFGAMGVVALIRLLV